MISIGGINLNRSSAGWDVQDPWANGVGVLDLPSMTWMNAYNATAAAYDSPQVVKDWYSNWLVSRLILVSSLLTNSRNSESISWSSDEVKSVFIPGSSPLE